MRIEEPVFILSADADWASEYCLTSFGRFLRRHDIRATLFVTHPSAVVDELFQEGCIERGIHPNFLDGSDHGDNVESILDSVFSLAPEAVCSRSHHLIGGSGIQQALRRRGIQYDSNFCGWMQEDLTPIRDCAGLIGFPILWADDVHWSSRDSRWDFAHYQDRFFSPGIKVISTHPFSFSLNLASQQQYLATRQHTQNLTAEEAERIEEKGAGVQTFLDQAVHAIKGRGFPILTLGEAFQRYGRLLLPHSLPPA